MSRKEAIKTVIKEDLKHAAIVGAIVLILGIVGAGSIALAYALGRLFGTAAMDVMGALAVAWLLGLAYVDHVWRCAKQIADLDAG